MDEQHRKALSIFYPRILESTQRVVKENLRLVHYTSADAAMKILKNREIWFRNVRCMNDYMEVDHGVSCLVETYNNSEEGGRFKDVMEELIPGVISDIEKLFDERIPLLRSSTYISCVSEHPVDDDRYGRLSMWRAYGGKNPVAIVMNSEVFRAESDVLSAYAHPVAYMDTDHFKSEFEELTNRVSEQGHFIRELGKEMVSSYLLDIFSNFAFCVKNPGFKEEREWRVIYNPAIKASSYVVSSIESVLGIPQEVHKISLENIPEYGLHNLEIPKLVDRIIIGPTDQQFVLGHAFMKLLMEAGCNDSKDRVYFSGIPLRENNY